VTTARQVEAELVTYCARVARGATVAVKDRREANVLAVAARILSRRFPAEVAHLDAVSEGYLRAHEDERVSAATTVRNGWIVSLPRLRQLLTHELETMRTADGRNK
jgi:hypothetical protein